MKIVLKEDVKGTGVAGDVVNVSSGHARNFLIPKGLAVEATPQALSEARQADAAVEHKAEQSTAAAKEIAAKIDGKTLKTKAQGGEAGKLFGSITTKDIVMLLKEQYEVNIERKQIDVKGTIKSFGTFEIKIRLYKGVVAVVHLVVAEEKSKK